MLPDRLFLGMKKLDFQSANEGLSITNYQICSYQLSNPLHYHDIGKIGLLKNALYRGARYFYIPDNSGLSRDDIQIFTTIAGRLTSDTIIIGIDDAGGADGSGDDTQIYAEATPMSGDTIILSHEFAVKNLNLYFPDKYNLERQKSWQEL